LIVEKEANRLSKFGQGLVDMFSSKFNVKTCKKAFNAFHNVAILEEFLEVLAGGSIASHEV